MTEMTLEDLHCCRLASGNQILRPYKTVQMFMQVSQVDPFYVNGNLYSSILDTTCICTFNFLQRLIQSQIIDPKVKQEDIFQ